MNGFFLHLSIADWVNGALETFVAQYGDGFHHFSVLVLRYLLVPLEGALRVAPPWLVLLVVGAIAWNATRRIGLGALFMLLLYAIGCFGLGQADADARADARRDGAVGRDRRAGRHPRVAQRGCGGCCCRCST